MANEDGIIKRILKKFTPYMPKHNMLFNVYGQPINEHPVVIWYSDNDDMYYFVKARRASKNGTIRNKLPTEILIPASATKSDSLFFKDSLLDCSQIFRMRAKDFEVAYGRSNYPEIDQLPFNYAMQIINQVEKNFKNDHISLMNVSIIGYNNKQKPIIEPELLYASKASFDQENGWWEKLLKVEDSETIRKANAFVVNYHRKEHTRVELNPVKAGIDITKEELMVDRVYTPIYHYIYNNKLLDKGANVAQIIDLVKKHIFNTEEFKDYKVLDADVWGSLTLPWGQRRTSLNIIDEYRINSDKLTKIQQNYFFDNIEDKKLLEFKSAYENEKLAKWVDNSCFYDEFRHYIKQEFEGYNWPKEEIATWFIKQRFRIKNISIIDKEVENRNLLVQQEHQEDEEEEKVQNQKTYRDEDTHQNTELTYEQLVQEWEEKWLKKDQDDKFEPPKKKMKM
ncbi:Mbov_0400 family ICE element protein [Mesomycoplasma ovipneumoniae]|uniref:Mbov_0400 family ICE element protein n=1 Tax=Mesomycoplasma ovipneumoniae TaxID=29562 RepID=UPI00311AF28F